jgi:hypothetical protein
MPGLHFLKKNLYMTFQKEEEGVWVSRSNLPSITSMKKGLKMFASRRLQKARLEEDVSKQGWPLFHQETGVERECEMPICLLML